MVVNLELWYSTPWYNSLLTSSLLIESVKGLCTTPGSIRRSLDGRIPPVRDAIENQTPTWGECVDERCERYLVFEEWRAYGWSYTW